MQRPTPQQARARAQSMQAPRPDAPTASRMQLRPRPSKKGSLGAIAASSEARQKRQRSSNTDKPASEMSAEEIDSQLSEIGDIQDGFSRMDMSPRLPPVVRPWSPALKQLPFRGNRYDQDLWDIFGARAKQRAGITEGGTVNKHQMDSFGTIQSSLRKSKHTSPGLISLHHRYYSYRIIREFLETDLAASAQPQHHQHYHNSSNNNSQ